MKKGLLNFLAYAAALLILLALFFFFVREEQIRLLQTLSVRDILITMLLGLPAYIGNGLEYFAMRSRLGFRMEKKDILLLPLGMNLLGTLLPVQGAMLYQLFIFKKKYHATIAKGFSASLFLYLLTVAAGGFAGVVFWIFRRDISIWFLLISVMLLLAPGGVFIADFLLARCPVRMSFLLKIKAFLQDSLSGVVAVLLSGKTVALLVLIYLLRFLTMVGMFAWVAHILGLEAGFMALVLLNFWNMLSLILKFTPNNLGVSQMASGALFAVIGLPAGDGIMISLVATLSFILTALTLGVAAVLYTLWEIRSR